MNFSPEAVAGMSDEHRAAFLAQLEHMQIRDRCGGGGGGPTRPPPLLHARRRCAALPRPVAGRGAPHAGGPLCRLRSTGCAPRRRPLAGRGVRRQRGVSPPPPPPHTRAAPPPLPPACVYSMRLYNNLVQRCFNDCVDDFRSKHLTTGEEKARGGEGGGEGSRAAY